MSYSPIPGPLAKVDFEDKKCVAFGRSELKQQP
jgi:hypothetical protein